MTRSTQQSFLRKITHIESIVRLIKDDFLRDRLMPELNTVDLVKSEGKASTSFLQRKLQIGYNRAARIIDMMEDNRIVSKPNHVGKREIL